MEAHPILRLLREVLPPLVISQDGLGGTLLTNKDLRKVLYRGTFAYDPKGDTWTLTNVARLRYRLNARTVKYLEELALPLGARDVGLHMIEPCSVGVSMQYTRDFFGAASFTAVAEMLYYELLASTVLLGTISRIANLCARLPDRSGTKAYRLLLPSRLVALTVCNVGAKYYN